MNLARRFAKNTFYMMIAKGAQPFLSVVLALVIGRILGVKVFGQYNTIMHFLALFQIMGSLGLRTLITREIAKDPLKVQDYFSNGVILSLPLSLLSIILMGSVIKIFQYDAQTTNAALIASVSLLAASFAETFEGLLAGLQEIPKIATTWIIVQVFKVGMSVLMIYMGFGLFSLFIVHVISRLLNPIIAFYFIRGIVGKIQIRFSLASIKRMMRTMMPFTFIMISTSLYWRIDTIMLSKMTTMTDTGIYNSAYKLLWLCIILLRSFFTAFFPMISQLFQSRADKFEAVCKQSTRYLFILVLPLCLIFTFYAKPIILLLFGDKFITAIPVLKILIWLLVPYAISEVFAYALLASNNQRIDLRVNLIALVLKMALNYFLITWYGFLGAAISALLAMTILLLLQLPFVLRKLIRFQVMNFLEQAFKLAVAGVLMSALALLIQSWNVVIAIVLTLAIYFISLILIGVFNDNDKILFRKIATRAY